ncbi:unnamed protein product [Effrenium voratum]|uniref:Uncharacterized protein n=1 Tax=Effrenium voratum TaxID=2562239 RepID=A0AA36MH34_9DINO|nr:unnamed protein product [Effrenium voratum]CAJ1421113.1 unnamed protein product [Effrenium voratum]
MGNFGSCHAPRGEQTVRTRVRVRRRIQAWLVLNLALGKLVAGGAVAFSRPSSALRAPARFTLTGQRPVPPRPVPRSQLGPALSPGLGKAASDTFLELLVYTTLWMSFSLASLVPFVQMECGWNLDWRPFWAAASESVAVYTLDHLRDIRKATRSTGEHKVSFQNGLARHRVLLLKALLGGSTLTLIASLCIARSWTVTLTFLGHVALCAAYAKLKRYMPYCKAFFVSACVVFMALAAPSAYAPALFGSLSAASMAQLLLLIFSVALTVEQLQDLRDVREDLEAQVVTLPSGLGPRRARQLLLGFQAASTALHVLIMLGARLPLRPHFLAVHMTCSLCALSFTRDTPRSLFQVLLEPLYALPLLATMMRASVGLSL